MRGASKKSVARARRSRVVLVAAATGGAAVALAAAALAATYTVSIAKSSVTNQSHATRTEKIVVNSGGFALYELTGDSKAYPKCTKANNCLSFWPAATVRSSRHLTKGPGVPGKLGVWRRDGFRQLTLNGHPLYRYAADARRHSAMGQGVKAFGGTWHVILKAGTSAAGW
jgi:predicted lipoprotein with Yx(FWY)xxD motif